MLDIKWIKSNVEAVKNACAVKKITLDIDELIAKHGILLELQKKEQAILTQRKSHSKMMATLTPEQRKEVKPLDISGQLEEIKPMLDKSHQEWMAMMYKVPNIPDEKAPRGNSEEDNVPVKYWGSKPVFNFTPLDHVSLLEKRNWAEFKRIGDICGGRSYCLKGELVKIERALFDLAIDHLEKLGQTLISFPAFVREKTLFGTGHFPDGRDQVYYFESDDLYLSGTAEVQANSLHAGEILDESMLPITYAAISPCFRREAGSYGKDVKGLIRVHQFIKAEQYVLMTNNLEKSQEMHQTLLKNSQEILEKLEIPYQVVDCCTGDMGVGKYRMYDIESWVPSENKYRETHSCSNLTDWQATRTNLRYKDKQGNIHFCYTLNNTALASPRILVPFLENHQQADGSIKIPKALQPYLGGRDRI